MAIKMVCDMCSTEDADVKKFIYIRCHELIDFETFKTQPENRIYICRNCYKKVLKRDMV